MRIVTLTCPGATQERLVARLTAEQEVVGTVWISTLPGNTARPPAAIRRLLHPLQLARHLIARRINAQHDISAAGLRDALGECDLSFIKQLPAYYGHDINDASAVDFVKSCKPDAVIVNGTNLLREPWHTWAPSIPHGIINIHTGLSPYSRGGNCNLFCILHGQLQFVGVTLHYIDSGIDSGDIIYTARPRIQPKDTYETIEQKVFRLGEDLAALALRQLASSGALVPYKQWTCGKEFLRRTGYVYSPYQRVIANRKLHEGRLVELYLHHKKQLDDAARVVSPALAESEWRHPLV